MDIECILTEEQLQEKLEYWGKKLKLDNWEVKVKLSRADNMSCRDNNGEIDYFNTTGYASIKILDPVDYPEDTMWKYDMEKVLVHELCHLHFSYFCPRENESLEYCMWERANETFARILVDMDRQIHGYPQNEESSA